MSREHTLGLAAAIALPPRLTVSGEEHAYVRHLDGLTYVFSGDQFVVVKK